MRTIAWKDASEVTYCVSSSTLNSAYLLIHSLTHSLRKRVAYYFVTVKLHHHKIFAHVDSLKGTLWAWMRSISAISRPTGCICGCIVHTVQGNQDVFFTRLCRLRFSESLNDLIRFTLVLLGWSTASDQRRTLASDTDIAINSPVQHNAMILVLVVMFLKWLSGWLVRFCTTIESH